MFVQNFMSRPHGFASMHCLYPYTDPIARLDHLETVPLAGGGNFTEIRGENKVSFCQILPCAMVNPLPSDLSPVVSYTTDIGLWVMRITANRPSPSAVPAYYLPWRKDHMMRMKLKPSPNHPKQELGVTLDPDLFVTAALQGCTVIVSGEPAQPLVYHLNAASVRGAGGETFGGDDAQFDIAAQAKIGHMQALFGQAQVQAPKEGAKLAGIRQPAVASLTGSAHVTQYMSGVKPIANEALRTYYSNLLGVRNPSVAQYGTVFGIRATGTWRFYRQTRTRVSYKSPHGAGYIYQWMDPVCMRFWP
ncbi:hypothetical protein [Paludibaculum fermentans]|uniref:hypothetical protein n=1 Tax=Paludibaculum fermentans TaxID=1473598 RepID=UPI003EBCF7EA